MRVTQFIFLMLTTVLATYWMNEAILAGEYLWAAIYGFFVIRNLRMSYRVSKVIQVLESLTKKQD
ncbi:hypothetical protein BVE84_01540 [Streptococcus azizii]|uniref:DUF3272 domain-containing protein n=1 Tax=Streptococcus azizii TaxID=1579424 RepID=A0AB36JRI1_9STRE|nr:MULTISPECIES: DUF3272 family protein [Streptococcus]MBF0775210.1 DUF3272 family protein [Streptococcus sp. 19428wD3_AN2]ONK29488.1 hypothetical protein BVE86_00230 [Streptococcus azizii]ONK29996.1 hypothetical protein BVE85_01540 [Streptococcus azizii]ONK30773.1 hypothetical protein BVE84_01540 [Streptococcus azizii]TFU84739.1 DUF3272 family protein [Streptococcus sp. AN2]